MDSLASHLELDEVLSPELALVDPELAERARRRLPEVSEWRPPPRLVHAAPWVPPVAPSIEIATFPEAASSGAVTRSAAAVVGALAAAIPLLLLAALLVGIVASEVRAQLVDPVTLIAPPTVTPPPVSAPPAPAAPPAAPIVPKSPPAKAITTPPVPAPKPRRTRLAPRPQPAPAPKQARPPRPTTAAPAPRRIGVTWVPTKREVETRMLRLLVEGRPTVPPALLDKRSGLLANNVHIVCRRVGRTARFTCRLGVGTSSSREWLLTVVVARNGTQSVTWKGRAPAH